MFTFNSNNTFCISLLSNIERTKNMQKRFLKMNMDVTIWPATTGETLTKNFINYLNNGQKGCAESHYNLWNYIFEKKISYAMILEDDVCFDKQFFEKINQFEYDIIDNEWDAIFLNASEPISTVNKWVKVNEQYLTGGYIISLRGINKLLSMFSQKLYASDWMTSRLQLHNHCYSYFPWLIIQEGKETTIGSNVDDDHKKVLQCLDKISYSLDNYII